jgi:hypothetical protein
MKRLLKNKLQCIILKTSSQPFSPEEIGTGKEKELED